MESHLICLLLAALLLMAALGCSAVVEGVGGEAKFGGAVAELGRAEEAAADANDFGEEGEAPAAAVGGGEGGAAQLGSNSDLGLPGFETGSVSIL